MRRLSLNIFYPARPAAGASGWRRLVDTALRSIGPTWRAAPWRRGVQALCLGIFLYSFLYVAWPYSSQFTASLFSEKEHVPAELFLWIDPLVGLSTALASRQWNVALWGMLGIFLACLAIPRGFCGYICPLGTLIDGFDWLISGRLRIFRIARIGRWAHLRYYVLAAVLVATLWGVLLSGYVSAIPVLTRGLQFTAAQLQLGWMKHWSMVARPDAAVYFSVALFAAIFLLGLLSPRFWCKYVCPSGACFSAANGLRFTERKVTPDCIHCGKCVQVCPFDAIKEDYATRTLECTFCQTCGGVCPTHAIQFVPRSSTLATKTQGEPETPSTRPLSRRAFVTSAFAGAAAAMGTAGSLLPNSRPRASLIRPPGSVDEQRFLDLCIRCGECFKVCPGPVLHPSGFSNGLEALWTPMALMTHAPCHPDCNFCTQVCPTGAIQPLTIEQKRHAVMGVAKIDLNLCLPHRGERDCDLCYQECEAAGYHAIAMREIKLDIGEAPDGALSADELDEMARINAPFVLVDACVGCGLCEYRCDVAIVRQRSLMPARAIRVLHV